MELSLFLKWMEKENLVNLNSINNDKDGKNSRFRIQKCMFIAQHLGLETKYKYERCLDGPMSTRLSEEYHSFAKENKPNASTTPFKFDAADTCRDIMLSHSNEWLEIATTLMNIVSSETNKERLIERTYVLKFPYSKKYIRAVLDELLQTPLSNVFAHLNATSTNLISK